MQHFKNMTRETPSPDQFTRGKRMKTTLLTIITKGKSKVGPASSVQHSIVILDRHTVVRRGEGDRQTDRVEDVQIFVEKN